MTQLKQLSFYGGKKEIKIEEFSRGHNTAQNQSNSPAKAGSSSARRHTRAEAGRWRAKEAKKWLQ